MPQHLITKYSNAGFVTKKFSKTQVLLLKRFWISPSLVSTFSAKKKPPKLVALLILSYVAHMLMDFFPFLFMNQLKIHLVKLIIKFKPSELIQYLNYYWIIFIIFQDIEAQKHKDSHLILSKERRRRGGQCFWNFWKRQKQKIQRFCYFFQNILKYFGNKWCRI